MRFKYVPYNYQLKALVSEAKIVNLVEICSQSAKCLTLKSGPPVGSLVTLTGLKDF